MKDVDAVFRVEVRFTDERGSESYAHFATNRVGRVVVGVNVIT